MLELKYKIVCSLQCCAGNIITNVVQRVFNPVYLFLYCNLFVLSNTLIWILYLPVILFVWHYVVYTVLMCR